MAEPILLSIAIPTFNRQVCLGLLLESICRQVDDTIADRLEVTIFDNCSRDQTTEVASSFLAGRSYLSYVRNERDIGADKNFIKAFFSARGKYVWIIGDDELLFDGAIKWVLGLCAGEEFGCAYLNSIPEVLAQMPQFLGREVRGPVHCRAYPPYAFAQAANYRLTFLSGSIVNKQGVLETNPQLIEDIDRFAGSNLVHLSWILSAILSKPRSCVVTTPLFASTMGNSGFFNPAEVFIASLSELFGYYLSKLQPDAKRFIRWFVLIGWFPKVMFDFRFRGRYRGTGYAVKADDFPADMRTGLTWKVFEGFVLKGSVVAAALAVFALKVWHKVAQRAYLMRGTEVTVATALEEGR